KLDAKRRIVPRPPVDSQRPSLERLIERLNASTGNIEVRQSNQRLAASTNRQLERRQPQRELAAFAVSLPECGGEPLRGVQELDHASRRRETGAHAPMIAFTVVLAGAGFHQRRERIERDTPKPTVYAKLRLQLRHRNRAAQRRGVTAERILAQKVPDRRDEFSLPPLTNFVGGR